MYNRIIFLILVFFVSHLTYSQGIITPENLSDIKMVNEVVVSDNGSYVAFSLVVPRCITEGIGYMKRELYVFDVNKNEIIPLITGNVNVSSLNWLSGKNIICFRQNTEQTKGNQIFCIDLSDKSINQITDFKRPINSFDFRNSDELFFTSIESTPAEKIALTDKGIDIKIFEEELLHLELYRYNIKNQKIERIIDNLTVYDIEVSPDGSKIAAAVSVVNHIDYYYMFQKIYIINAKSGDIEKQFNNPGKLGKMSWSPDSKRLAFVSGSDIHDAVCGSLFVMNVNERTESFEELTNLVQGKELSVTDVIWDNNEELLYTAEVRSDMALYKYNIKTEKHESVIKPGELVFRRIEKSKNKVYMAGNTSSHPNELYSYDVKDSSLEKLSENNLWLKDIKLAKQEKITYSARDGKDIEGVLVYPLNFEEGKRYPVIVYIHGGPESAVQDGWTSHYSTWGQFAAARDYFVFSPNYRASSGRGVDFTMAGYGDLLGTEYNDVLDGIDYLINIGFADKDKIGIGGGSYGGFFAAYSATKHSEKFAAAVVFVGISNQVSKRKTTDIPLEDYLVHWGFWTHENHKKVWDASPVQYATNNQTPTLILHGEEDTRIPVSQGLELYRALKLHGKAPVRFVLYPGEGHGNAKNINRFDYLVRTLDWFDYYIKTKPGSKEMPSKYYNFGSN